MTQINFSLSQEEFIGLFCEGRSAALRTLLEQVLNQFIEAESTAKLGAGPYERSEQRRDYRNGTRIRRLNTRVGTVKLEVPRHRYEVFHSVLMEKYQRTERAFISVLMEMVLQGVSTRKVEKVTQELCGVKFSRSHVSEICKNLDPMVEAFRNRRLDEDEYPFIMADAIYIKVREDFRVRSKGLLIAMGINMDGKLEVLGFELCEQETEYHWESFFKGLKERGLKGVDFVTSDDHKGLVAAIRTVFQNASWQRCQFHFMRNIVGAAPKRCQKELTAELKEMFNAHTLEKAVEKRNEIFEKYSELAKKSMEVLDRGFFDATTVMSLPLRYRTPIRTSNYIERENREIRRREKVIGIFPNQDSALRLLGALLLDHHEQLSTCSRVFNMNEYLNSREHFCYVTKQRRIA